MRVVVDHERAAIGTLAFLSSFLVVAFFSSSLNDGDTWWHLATGRLIAAELSVPTLDPFSYSRPGAPWHAHEWGSEVILWATYDWFGRVGLVCLAGLAAGSASAILALFSRRYLPPVAVIVVATMTMLCLLPSALVRPHLLALPLFLFWVANLLRFADEHRPPPLPYAAIMIIWANLHASFVLGILLMAPLALEQLIVSKDKLKISWHWARFGIACLAAAMVTPFGIMGFIYPFQVSSMDALQHIMEWRPSNIQNFPIFFGVLLLSLLSFLTLGVRFPLLRGLTYITLLYMALTHVRHQFLFEFVGWLFAAQPLGNALREKIPSTVKAVSVKFDRMAFMALAAVTIAAIAIRLSIPVEINQRHKLPLQLIQHIPPNVTSGRVFNNYSFGGPLIFYGIRPFIDGRADMYGDAFVQEFMDAEGGRDDAWRPVFARYGVTWTILAPDSALVASLERAGWRKVMGDDRAVVHISPRSTQAASVGGNQMGRRFRNVAFTRFDSSR